LICGLFLFGWSARSGVFANLSDEEFIQEMIRQKEFLLKHKGERVTYGIKWPDGTVDTMKSIIVPNDRDLN
jgi:hypothetical protein